MGLFTVIPQDTFDGLQLDAGVLLKRFDPAKVAAPADEDIICATTGGINISCVPTYSDLGEDVDNCPVNTKELKHLDGWECKMSFTALGTSPENIKLALGAATVSTTKVTPNRDLKQADFSDIWWAGDRADGGVVAACLKNALSTGGFTLQTTKNGKGQVSVELTGHVSIEAQDTMPMEFYSIAPPLPGVGG
nr:MAG TPA: major tail protein [Caudoviricetes sp.]